MCETCCELSFLLLWPIFTFYLDYIHELLGHENSCGDSQQYFWLICGMLLRSEVEEKWKPSSCYCFGLILSSHKGPFKEQAAFSPFAKSFVS